MQQLFIPTMTTVDLRRLLKWCDRQPARCWKDLNLTGLVTLYNATAAHQYKTFEKWWRADHGAASAALELVRAECSVTKGD